MFGDKIPVDQVPIALDILGTRIAVVDVIGVLPYIAGQQGLPTLSHRIACISGVHYIRRVIGIFHQPGPARAEVRGRRLRKSVPESRETAELLVDNSRQLTLWGPAAIGAQAVPVHRVVPYLRRVVEDPAGGFCNDLLERRRFEFSARYQFVLFLDLAGVVLAVVSVATE